MQHHSASLVFRDSSLRFAVQFPFVPSSTIQEEEVHVQLANIFRTLSTFVRTEFEKWLTETAEPAMVAAFSHDVLAVSMQRRQVYAASQSRPGMATGHMVFHSVVDTPPPPAAGTTTTLTPPTTTTMGSQQQRPQGTGIPIVREFSSIARHGIMRFISHLNNNVSSSFSFSSTSLPGESSQPMVGNLFKDTGIRLVH